MSDVRKQILQNSMLRMGGYTVGTVLFFVTFVLIARYLGAEEFGYFSFVMAFVGIFQVAADMGVRNVLIREIALDKVNFRERLGVAKVLLWMLSLLSLVLIVILANVFTLTEQVRQSTYVAAVAEIFLFYGLGYSAVLRAFEEMGLDILGFVLHKVVLITLIWSVMKMDFGLLGVFFALLVANASQWFYLWAIVAFRHGRAKLRFDLNSGLILLKEAFPLGIAEILRRSTRHVGRLLLAALSTPAAVGLFSAAYKFMEGMTPFTLNLTLPLFPVFSRLAKVSHARLFRAYEQSLKFLYAAGFPIAVITFVLSERIVTLVFGEPYRDAASALRIFAPAIVFLMTTSVYGYIFTALGRQRTYMVCVAISLVVNIVLDLLLIPSFSYNGAAVGTLVSEVVLFLAGLFVLRNLGSDLTSLLVLWRPILASLVMGAICWVVRDKTVATMVVGVFSSAAVYIGILFVLQTFTQEEHALFVDAFRIRSGSSLP